MFILQSGQQRRLRTTQSCTVPAKPDNMCKYSCSYCSQVSRESSEQHSHVQCLPSLTTCVGIHVYNAVRPAGDALNYSAFTSQPTQKRHKSPTHLHACTHLRGQIQPLWQWQSLSAFQVSTKKGPLPPPVTAYNRMILLWGRLRGRACCRWLGY
jgi:hypothetical protein